MMISTTEKQEGLVQQPHNISRVLEPTLKKVPGEVCIKERTQWFPVVLGPFDVDLFAEICRQLHLRVQYEACGGLEDG